MCGCHTGYILCKAELADAIDKGVYPGVAASMHLQTVAAVAYAMKKAGTAEFKKLMQDIVTNAKALSAAFIDEGFDIVTGGTDCHMMTVDVRPLGIDGKTLTARLENIGISVNSKSIPYEESKLPGGIRIGTIIPTQMGMTPSDMAVIANIIAKAAKSDSAETVAECKSAVSELIKKCKW